MEENDCRELSVRSSLYSIEPLGLGTPYVESLTSYISRLASYHCVLTGTLIFKLLSPQLNIFYIEQIAERGGNGFFDSSSGINGIGKLAIDFINIIQKLNFRTDLQKTTLLGWGNVLPTRGLMRTVKAWCGVCYQEKMINNEPIYDQLIWYVKEVKCCPKHKIALETQCPNCSRTIQILSRKSLPGYCQHCYGWLGVKDSPIAMKSSEEIYRAAVLIGELLSRSSSESAINLEKNIVPQATKNVSEQLFEGKIGKMAKFIQIPGTTLRYWIKGINLIPLPSLIKICLQLDISILELLGIEEFPVDIQLPQKDLAKNSSKSRSKFDYKIIKRVLDNEIINEQSKSLTKVAEIIGCDRKLLYKKFPNECQQIVDNYQREITAQKVRRENNIKNQLENIAYQLSENGEYPSRRKVEKLLEQKYFVKEKNIREQWNRLKINYYKILNIHKI